MSGESSRSDEAAEASLADAPGKVERAERTLRRLALNDERYLRSALADPGISIDLDAKTQALIRLGALLAIGAGTVSLRCTVELAAAAGASDDEIVDILLAIAPAVGHARVVGVAPHLGLALGYDFELEEQR
jgi:alkylhydroperoxidase/carboxymuconolactone decarboxylase family protein YurZ